MAEKGGSVLIRGRLGRRCRGQWDSETVDSGKTGDERY